MMVYFIVADGRSSKAFEDYFDALDALRHIDETDPSLDARLIAIDSYEAGPYLRMPQLTPSK